MDVISFITAIGAVISAVNKTVQFFEDVAGAGEERGLLVDELKTGLKALEALQELAKKAPTRTPALQELTEDGGPCVRYLKLVEGLKDKFTKHGRFHRMRYVRNRLETERTLAMLRAQLNAIEVYATSDHLGVSLRIEDKLDRLQIRDEPVAIYKQEKPLVPYALYQPDFVGREEDLEALATQFRITNRVGLCGRGGMGKTWTALRCLHQVHQAYPDRAIFWVDATSRLRFETSYQSILIEIPQDFKQYYSR